MQVRTSRTSEFVAFYVGRFQVINYTAGRDLPEPFGCCDTYRGGLPPRQLEGPLNGLQDWLQ
jgi:hypothetical protein